MGKKKLRISELFRFNSLKKISLKIVKGNEEDYIIRLLLIPNKK